MSMSGPKPLRAENISENLLFSLLVGVPAVVGHYAIQWMTGEDIFKGLKRRRIRGRLVPRHEWNRTYRRYKKKGLIEDRIVGDRLMVRLTDEGFKKAWRGRIKSIHETSGRRQSCIVIFDIPEKQREARDMLRGFLQECGFKMLQLSVWRCDREIAADLVAFVKHLGLSRWVRVIEGTEKL